MPKNYQSKLIAYPHAFFTRLGGFSNGVYDSLNMSVKRGDNLKNVTKNREVITNFFALPTTALKIANQVHGNATLIIDNLNQDVSSISADAMVTKIPGIVLGVTTADCCPLLLCDPVSAVIAAIHAGHRGAYSGIIQSAIDAMLSMGAKKKNLVASLGPCIASKSYEVDKIFKQRFLSQLNHNEIFFYQTNASYLFDLKAYALHIIKSQGIDQFDKLNIDTYQDPDFFSCRRSYHKGQNEFGVQLSAICIK